MRPIGIDVSKEKLNVFISESEQFEITNTTKGFSTLFPRLKKDDVVGVESTSTYHHHIASFLLEKGLVVKELNPLMTKQFIRVTVRKKKTDKSDAEIVARLIAQGEGYAMTQKQMKNTVRRLWRSKQKLIKMRTSLKLQLRAAQETLEEVKEVTRAFRTLIRSFDRQIENLHTHIMKIEGEDMTLLESIPGISAQLARGLCAEIGDFRRFPSKEQLIAFAGLDPKLSESGTSLHARGRLTKRGSPYIRIALYQAAFANVSRKTVFGDYYRKKRSENKHHTIALCATSRKILEVAYALVTKRTPFLN